MAGIVAWQCQSISESERVAAIQALAGAPQARDRPRWAERSEAPDPGARQALGHPSARLVLTSGECGGLEWMARMDDSDG